MAKPFKGWLLRWVWAPVLGAAILAGAVGLHASHAPAAVQDTAPRPGANATYTARVDFSVVPVPPGIGTPDGPVSKPSDEDIKLIVARQVFLLQSEGFLTALLGHPAFHKTRDGTPGETPWLAQNRQDALGALKRNLKVIPHPEAAAFEITMTTGDPIEARDLVQAAAEVFKTRLWDDLRTRRSSYLNNLESVLQNERGKSQNMSDAIADYAQRRHLDALNSAFEIEKSALEGLNLPYTQAEAAAQDAERQVAALRKRNAGQELALPSDLLQAINSDPTLITLLNTRNFLRQDLAVAALPSATAVQNPAESEARLKEVEVLIGETRKKLLADAADLLVKRLTDDAATKRFLADYLGGIRTSYENVIVSVARDIGAYRLKLDELKGQQEIVAALTKQYALASANVDIDDTQVRQIDPPVVPAKPD